MTLTFLSYHILFLCSWPDKGDQRIRLKKEKLSVRMKRNIENYESKLAERSKRRLQGKYVGRKQTKRRVRRNDIKRGTKRRGRRSSPQNGKKVKKIKTRVKPNFWDISM